ncbi:MAG: hypothetical protein A2Z64_05170 [Betaproteobacteria bacterium RIFCSPLOWO2_02_67_12]|nr:MAG: hypothetical protein A2Z64_05170 [Betaproteobacteria bacterium RIFCSPLOWO2_02_67_12]
MAWMPIHMAQAGIISTDQAIMSAQSDRAAVLNLIQRSDVAGQLQSLGVDLAAAKDRVGAMTDDEVRSLAGQLQSLPAGADGTGLVVLILVGVLVWYFFFRR